MIVANQMRRRSNSFIALVTSLFLLCTTHFTSARAEISDSDGAIAVNFFWTEAQAYTNMTWITRDVVITKSGDGTYFSIIGNWTPPFYIGVQDFDNQKTGRIKKVAIFSAWDTGENNNCTNCGPEERPTVGRTTLKDVGPGVTPGQFGYEGTGVNAFINDFGWKVGDRVRAVVNIRTVSDGTEISAALQLNSSNWRYFGTYKYETKFSTLQPGGSFIEDFGNTPRIVRAAEFGNTWMESEDLSSRTPINFVQARANTGLNTKYHLIKQINPTGLWAQVGGDEFVSKQEFVPAKIEVPEDLLIPLEARVAALNLSGEARKSYEEKYAKYKSNRAEAKAAAEAKAKQEAEAKVKAERDRALLNEEIKKYGSLDNYIIYFDPDPTEAAGFLTSNRFNYNTKQIRVVKSHPGTNFIINGSYGSTPGFLGGLQETTNGRRQVFITAYNLDESTCKLVTCVPRTSQRDWNVEVLSSELVTRKEEFTTHTDLYSSNITWSPGELITWLTVLSPEKNSSVLSVAIKVGTGSWQHLASIRYPALYESGLAGGYGRVADYSTPNPFTSRIAEYSPTVLENFAGVRKVLTNLYLIGPKEKNRHSFAVNSFGLSTSVGIEPQTNTQSEYRLSLEKSSEFPQSSEGQSFVNEIVAKLSSAAKEYRQSVEAKTKAATELKAKQEADAKAAAEAKAIADKAAAELKAKQEAEAKAAAELKAKQEAEAKAAAELKAKQEAEAKAAAELKAKQEADAKAAAEKLAADKALSDANSALAKSQSDLRDANSAKTTAEAATKQAVSDKETVEANGKAALAQLQTQLSSLNAKMAEMQLQIDSVTAKFTASQKSLATVNAKLKKICAVKPKPKGC